MKASRKLLVGVAVLLVALSAAVLLIAFSGDKESSVHADLTRVACVGDSITEWSGYPTYLQLLLGNESLVRGFGIAGATVVNGSDRPIMAQTVFFDAQSFHPTAVVILLGTNDARTNIYRDHNATFIEDYKALVAAFQALPNKPQVFLATPPPLYPNSLSLSIENLEQGVIPKIRQVAADLNLPIIDVYGAMKGHPELFEDGVHPTNQGAETIANTIYKAIK